MPPSLAELGIRSEHEAAELERELDVRFNDFTPEDCDTWIRQSIYLNQYSRTRALSIAADEAGVSVMTARSWQADNTLGFNKRLEVAVIRYTDVLEVMLLQRAQQPDSPPSLLMMLIRAQAPEKYGPVRRGGPPRDDNACDHDSQPATTSQYDRELLEKIFQDLQNVKQFAGLSEPPVLSPLPEGEDEDVRPNPASDLSPAAEETHTGGIPTATEQAPAGEGFSPAPTPQHLAPRTSTAASAANSNALKNGKNPTSPAPPTNPTYPSFPRRRESIATAQPGAKNPTAKTHSHPIRPNSPPRPAIPTRPFSPPSTFFPSPPRPLCPLR